MRSLFFCLFTTFATSLVFTPAAEARAVTLADLITPWERVERPSHDTVQQWTKELDSKTRMDIVMLSDDTVFYTVRRTCSGTDQTRTTVFTGNQKVLSATDCRGNDIRDNSIAPWMLSDELPILVRIALIKNRRAK